MVGGERLGGSCYRGERVLSNVLHVTAEVTNITPLCVWAYVPKSESTFILLSHEHVFVYSEFVSNKLLAVEFAFTRARFPRRCFKLMHIMTLLNDSFTNGVMIASFHFYHRPHLFILNSSKWCRFPIYVGRIDSNTRENNLSSQSDIRIKFLNQDRNHTI